MSDSRRFWTTIEEREALRAHAVRPPVAPGGSRAHAVRPYADPEAAGSAAQGEGHGEREHDDHEHPHPEQRGQTPVFDRGTGWDLSRRTFLTATGFSLAGLLAACGRKSVVFTAPGSEQPEEVVQGRAAWYATTCAGCAAGCGLLVRCREGRPVKVEGNPDHPVSKGGVCAAGQASLLGLYDSKRLLHPVLDGMNSSWPVADARVKADLERVKASGGALRILSPTVTSPSTRAAIEAFLAAFPGAKHVEYDALSCSALLDAYEKVLGARVLPRFHFENAETIVGIECDFLGTWISPVEFTKGWRQGRTLAGSPPRMSLHLQVESALTLTGSNADRRWRIEPGVVGLFVSHLAARVASKTGFGSHSPSAPLPADLEPVADLAAKHLLEKRGKSLLVCGTNDLDVQALVAFTNEALGAHGTTIDVASPSFQRRGDDKAFAALVLEMEAKKVGALVVAGCNPVADAAGGARFGAALGNVDVRVVLAERPDETTKGFAVVLPLPHPLEAWDDAEPVAGLLSVTQPTVAPFGEPRSLRECLAAWSGKPAQDLVLLKDAWRRDQQPRQSEAVFERFWKKAVHDGFVPVSFKARRVPAFDSAAGSSPKPTAALPASGKFALVALPSVAMLDGRHAENPWLLEMPDPITKQVWGNAALISEASARGLGVSEGQVVRISAEGTAIELPVIVQPGMADRTVAVAMGFGRVGTDRFADVGPSWLEGKATVARGGTVGKNIAPFLRFERGAASLSGIEVAVAATSQHEQIAKSQTYSTQEVPKHLAPAHGEKRDAVRETTLSAFAADPKSGHPKHHAESADLWGERPYEGKRWRMAIDLNACTGCSACVVACQSENNVPVVGRDEVLRRRDMAWMRIDRYYADVPGAEGEVDVVHQPMLCHHCENAPCETVCPVLATVHDSEGLNGQVYNRCVGTRYCANNCPYKVRRFNWFDYKRPDRLADLALNPDVTVRSRGVMEKCSFCVQRLHEAKAEAKRLGRPLADGDAKPACQQSCPADAIVFGDANDPRSRIAQVVRKDPRHYRLLEELNVKPSVGYLTKVRHREGGPSEGTKRHG